MLITKKYITTLDLARARGAKSPEAPGTRPQGIPASEFDRLGIPFFAGCQVCGASLGPFNSYPSVTGFIRCRQDIEGYGFDTVARYDTWEKDYADVVAHRIGQP